jgi:hypothetical protein
MALTKIKEADGDIPGAAEILHELQVSNLSSQYSHQTFYFLVSSSFARDFFSAARTICSFSFLFPLTTLSIYHHQSRTTHSLDIRLPHTHTDVVHLPSPVSHHALSRHSPAPHSHGRCPFTITSLAPRTLSTFACPTLTRTLSIYHHQSRTTHSLDIRLPHTHTITIHGAPHSAHMLTHTHTHTHTHTTTTTTTTTTHTLAHTPPSTNVSRLRRLARWSARRRWSSFLSRCAWVC